VAHAEEKSHENYGKKRTHSALLKFTLGVFVAFDNNQGSSSDMNPHNAGSHQSAHCNDAAENRNHDGRT
jgi:hypothetical protein